jgi:hypothetical protein
MEAALIAILVDVAAALAAPALALLSSRPGAFKVALLAPPFGLPLIVLATWVFGT